VKFSRVTVIVLDGVGIGEAPDSADYGDQGSHSLANTARAVGGLSCPHFASMGLGCIDPIEGVPCGGDVVGAYGKMTPASPGKDTVTGHWELMGVPLPAPFPTYPQGFPKEVIESFEKAIGRRSIGNKVSSGTVILEELGEEHIRTGFPIVYTSADSVFQIAANESVIPLEELHAICEKARALLVGEHGVGRVIARPFVGDRKGGFTRTSGRRDYPRNPPERTVMQALVEAGHSVCTVGKIDDIFAHQGITRSNHTPDNATSFEATLEFLKTHFSGLLFTNLIECDMIYGHRNDPKGYAGAIETIDKGLPRLMELMSEKDLLIFTADHGVDPTTPGTDHSREYVPLLAWTPGMKHGVDLGVRATLSDVAATLAENFGLEGRFHGTSFLSEVVS